jgi:hypothetical protein
MACGAMAQVLSFSVKCPVARAYAKFVEPMTSMLLAPRYGCSPFGKHPFSSRRSGIPAVCDSETSYVLQSSSNRKRPCGFPLQVELRNLLGRGTMTDICNSAKFAASSGKHVRLPFRSAKRWAR